MKVTKEEIKSAHEKLEHKCEFCDRRFKAARHMKIHRTSCKYAYGTTEKRYEIDDIVGGFGRREARWFLVKFTGYEEPEWQRGHLLEIDAKDAVREFWVKSGLNPSKDFYADKEGKHRCCVCARVFKRTQDLKSHRTRQKHHVETELKITPLAKKEAEWKKREAEQEALPMVKWGEEPASN